MDEDKDKTGEYFKMEGCKYRMKREPDGTLVDSKGNKLCQHGCRNYCRAGTGCFPPQNPLCIHGKRKYRCPLCKGIGKGFGTGLCEHNKQRGQCARCRIEHGHGLGTFFCPITGKQMRDCPHCTHIPKRQRQRKINRDPAFASAQGLTSTEFLEHETGVPEMEEEVDLGDFFDDHEFAQRRAFNDELGIFLQDEWAPGSASGSAQGSAPVFSSEDWDNQGGKKCKRFTRRLRRNHNTKKKSKLVKRKIIKYSRKNKHKSK